MKLGAPLGGCLAALTLLAGLAAQEVRDTIGPLEQQSRSASAENPIPRRTSSVSASYPAEAAAIAAAGRVDLVVTLDGMGRIGEIRTLTNTMAAKAWRPATQTALRAAADAFMREAASALQRWTYEPPGRGPVRFTVTFSFEQGIEPTSREIRRRWTPFASGNTTRRRCSASSSRSS